VARAGYLEKALVAVTDRAVPLSVVPLWIVPLDHGLVRQHQPDGTLGQHLDRVPDDDDAVEQLWVALADTISPRVGDSVVPNDCNERRLAIR
jgi:hypothetical protein